MGTDRYAYSSRLKEVDPIPKLWFSLTVLLVCLFSESISVGLVTALVMGVLTVRLGGQRPETVLHFLKIPLAFLVIGCATIVLRPISEETEALCAFHLLGQFRWGITVGYLQMGLMVFCKAVGAISAMYFLSLNTPVTDLTMALERLHVPRLLVELMELIYRQGVSAWPRSPGSVIRGSGRVWSVWEQCFRWCFSGPGGRETGCTLHWRPEDIPGVLLRCPWNIRMGKNSISGALA